MKKIFTFILMLVLACSLIGCGHKEDKTHTIIFYHTMGDSLQKVLKTAKDDFAAKFPGWKVEDTAVGGYDDVKKAIIADLQGGSQPSLAYCYADHVAQYMETGKVVDMSQFISRTDTIDVVKGSETVAEVIGYSEEEVNDFVTGYYNEGLATNYADYAANGYTATSMMTLPFVKSTELVYYNKTALKAAKIEKAPETWDELWADAAILKAKYPNCVPVGYDSEANWFITMCEQNGWGYTSAENPHYLFNTDPAKAWLNDLNTKFNNGLVTTQIIYGSYTSNLFVKGPQDGGVVFSIGSSGGASHQKPADGTFEWGVAPIPGSTVNGTVVRKAISQGPSLCMFYEDIENKDEKTLMTWEFVKMLLDPTFQASFSLASGYNPSRVSTYDIEEYDTALNENTIIAAAAKVAKTMTNDFFTSPAFVGSSMAREQVGKALAYAVAGEKSADDALQDAMRNCGAR